MLLPVKMFFLRVFGIGRHEFQVLYSVVRSVVVAVVDDFLSCKETTKMLFHNNSMLKDIALRIAVRVRWNIDHIIAAASNVFARKVRELPNQCATFQLSSKFLDARGKSGTTRFGTVVFSSIIKLARKFKKFFSTLTGTLNLSALPIWVVYSCTHTPILG